MTVGQFLQLFSGLSGWDEGQEVKGEEASHCSAALSCCIPQRPHLLLLKNFQRFPASLCFLETPPRAPAFLDLIVFFILLNQGGHQKIYHTSGQLCQEAGGVSPGGCSMPWGLFPSQAEVVEGTFSLASRMKLMGEGGSNRGWQWRRRSCLVESCSRK